MSQNNSNVTVRSGGFPIVYIVGMAFAAWCSHTLGNPMGWVVIHAIFSWWYILYLCGGCGGGFPPGVF